MDSFEFILGITDSLAWPVTVILIVFLLRSDIGAVLRKVKRLKHKDTEVDFERELEVALETAASDSTLAEPLDDGSEMSELAKYSPRGAIIESWLQVEKALKVYAEKHGLEFDERKPFRLGQGHAENSEYARLGNSTIETLKSLRFLRNQAVHMSDTDLDYQEAIEYQELARKVVRKLENA